MVAFPRFLWCVYRKPGSPAPASLCPGWDSQPGPTAGLFDSASGGSECTAHLSRSIHLGTTAPLWTWLLGPRERSVRRQPNCVHSPGAKGDPDRHPNAMRLDPCLDAEGPPRRERWLGRQGGAGRGGRRWRGSGEPARRSSLLCSSPSLAAGSAAFARSWAVLPDPYLSELHVNHCQQPPVFQGIQAPVLRLTTGENPVQS